jgi:16S rRNA (guanine(966)-N(2))-methyltransferase RsmD
MRVIAGTARGIALAAPRDRATRPITDRVKETLFGILADRVVDAQVLDLYAGSGAIGIEALSRGAGTATFVEHARAAVAALRTNLERTRLGASASVRQEPVERFLDHPAGAPWDLVFLDPPYEERAILAPLERVMPVLALGGVVVVKHFWRTEVPAPPGMAPSRTRRFGETALTFLADDRRSR